MLSLAFAMLGPLSSAQAAVTKTCPLVFNDAVLREFAAPVLVEEISSPQTQSLISTLIKTMEDKQAVGIAAPQVGVSQQILIAQVQNQSPQYFWGRKQNVVMINPRIEVIDNGKVLDFEGCLSIPNECGVVARPKKINVEYLDEKGETQGLVLTGLSARVVQHEVDHLNGILFTDYRTENLLTTVLNSGRSDEQNRLASLVRGKTGVRKISKRFVDDWADPYGLVIDVVNEVKKNGQDPVTKIAELVQILSDETPRSELGVKLDHWTQSESQALLLTESLYTQGLSRYWDVLDYLHANNLYMSDAYPVRGPPGREHHGLVTYSFEKEGFNPAITELYRNPSFTEKMWHRLSQSDRLKSLKRMGVQKKVFLGSEVVAPNSTKPAYLGGFSVELNDSERTNWGWEIANKRFEISRHRIIKEVRELALIFHETHSFHLHIVFELPKKYAAFKSFARWYKHANDYLYLRGVEEGLHGNYLTNIVNDGQDLPFAEMLADAFPLTPATKLVSNQSSLDQFSSKFFTMGLRSGPMYGPASSAKAVKVGLELRDTTRKLDDLDRYTKELTDSVADYRWEKLSPEFLILAENTPRLTTGRKVSIELLQKHMTREKAERFYDIDHTAAMPFTAYEDGLYFNFRTGAFEKPSEEMAGQLRDARAVYARSLENILIEIEGMRARGEKVDRSLIQGAVRMSISDWAKAARPSRLYQNY